MEECIIRLDERDNVGVAAEPLRAGETYAVIGGGVKVTALEDIGFGHKIALEAIPAGNRIVKYGEVIAFASVSVGAGSHVHVHNMRNTIG